MLGDEEGKVLDAARHSSSHEHGTTGLDVATSRLVGDPTATQQNILNGATQKVQTSGAAVTKRMRDIGRTEAQISACCLEVVPKRRGSEGKQERIGRR